MELSINDVVFSLNKFWAADNSPEERAAIRAIVLSIAEEYVTCEVTMDAIRKNIAWRCVIAIRHSVFHGAPAAAFAPILLITAR